MFRKTFAMAAIGAALLTSPANAANTACQASPVIKDQTTLRELSSTYFGDYSYRYAILLATNARANEEPYGFIGDPNRIRYQDDGKWVGPTNVCIPAQAEADRLKNRFNRYLDAVGDMALAEPSEVVHDLDPVGSSGPAQVVSWVRADQAAKMPAPGERYKNKWGATWVTLDPHLRNFCQNYVEHHSEEEAAVTLRLEQRLGLPPNASKTHFVVFELENPRDQSNLFRPCGDTEVTDTSCQLGPRKSCPEGDAICHAQRDFYFEQYYNSYGAARPVEYPWTSLGYTFDWAPGPVQGGGKIGFVAVGESEYVVPKNIGMTVVSVEETMDFCAP